ncbi:unnamed protein product [Effrenium voratum]|nr:unnamed protein product [Effrenium voratum]
MGHSLKDNLHVIHGFPNIMDATPLVPGVWLGGQLQELAQAVQASGQKAPLRFIFGQSSWSYTQLQLELSCGVWAMARSQTNAVSLCFVRTPGARRCRRWGCPSWPASPGAGTWTNASAATSGGSSELGER